MEGVTSLLNDEVGIVYDPNVAHNTTTEEDILETVSNHSEDAISEKLSSHTMTLSTVLSVLTESSPQWRMSEWSKDTAHPFLVCKCAEPCPMMRREGARGKFWGCPNFPRGCGLILNDTPAKKRLADMLRVVEEMYRLHDIPEYMQSVAPKRKHAPQYRALFNPVQVLLRDVVGNTRINHVAPFSAKATSSPPTNLHFYNRDLAMTHAAARMDIERDNAAAKAMTPLWTEQTVNVSKLLSTIATASALPTAEIYAPPPTLELQAITYLGKQISARKEVHFVNESLGLASFSYDSTCRDEIDFGVFQELRSVVGQVDTPTSWLNAANAVTRLSANIHYYLHHKDRVYSVAVITPWPHVAGDKETVVALNWRGLGEFDAGFLPSCEAEILLVPSAAVDSASFEWRLVNNSRLNRCLLRKFDELKMVHYIFGGGRDLSCIPSLSKKVDVADIIASANVVEEKPSGTTTVTPIAHHDANPDELLCGSHCRIPPASELSVAQSAELLNASGNRVMANALTTQDKSLANYFALTTMTDPKGKADNHDRYLLATLSSFDLFMCDFSLYCDDEVL